MKLDVKDQVKWVAYRIRNMLRAHGIDIGQAYPERSPGAFFMLYILPRLQVDLVVDVGARLGEYSQDLRNAGYAGPILSFEPVPGNLEVLRRVSRYDPLWHVFPYALGSADGSAEMHVTRFSALSSVLEPNELGRSYFGSDVDVTQKLTVPLRRLDGVLPSILQEKNLAGARTFLKIDTQGYDLEVLRGAKGVLEAIPACALEVAFRRKYEGAALFGEALHYMAGIGYDLAALFRVAYDDHLALAEADAFFIRTGPIS